MASMDIRQHSRSQSLANLSTPGQFTPKIKRFSGTPSGQGVGPVGVNKRSSERTAEDGTERGDVGSPGAAGYVRGGAPDETKGGAGVSNANGVPTGAGLRYARRAIIYNRI